MFKKTTVIVLCLTLLLTFWPFQHASASECIVMQHPETGESIFYKVLSDNNHFRRVEVWDSSITVISTFYKSSVSLEVQTIDVKSGHERIEIIELNENAYDIAPNAIYSNTDLTGGFSWYNDSSIKFWSIRIPDNGKMTYESLENKDDILEFADRVDTLRGHQYTLRAAVGGTIFTTVVALLLTPEPLWTKIAAVVLAAGLAIALLPIAYSIFNTQHRCRHFFDRVTVASGPRPYGEIWIQD